MKDVEFKIILRCVTLMLLNDRVLISQTSTRTVIRIFNRWSNSSEEFNLKRGETHVLWKWIGFLSEPSGLQENVLESSLTVRLKLKWSLSIKFKVSDRLIRFQRWGVLKTLCSPLLIILFGELVERISLLEGRQMVSSENDTWTDRESSTLWDCLRSYDELINRHWVSLEMFKEKLRSWVVARKYLVIIHHNSANLESLIVRCTLMMVNYERKESLLGQLRIFRCTRLLS